MTAQQVVWDESIAFGDSLSTPMPSFWYSVTERVKDQATSPRGRQYEWDQMQAGQHTPTLVNTDGALTPTNTASPFSPNVDPRRPYRKRFQYPATQQLLTGDQASSGDFSGLAAGTLATTFGLGSQYDAACAVVTSGTAFQGTRVMQASVPASPTLHNAVFFAVQWSLHPGVSHAFSARVRVPGGTVSPTVHASIIWVDINFVNLSEAAGTSTVITAGSATWIQLNAAGKPPANAAGAFVRIALDVAPGAFVMQSDGWQVELAAAPTTWTMPGAWGYVINAFVDRWPTTFDKNGTYALSTPTATDAFGFLSQTYPQPPFYNDVLALSPSFFFPLDDPQGNTTFRDLTGNFAPAPAVSSPRGPGTVAAGESVQATVPTGVFLGTPGPAVQMTNPNLPALGNIATCSWIELDRVGITGPPETGGWTRMIAFNNSGAGTSGNQALWQGQSAGFEFASAQGFFVLFGDTADANAGVLIEFEGLTTDPQYSPPTGSFADGNWHLLFMTNSADGLTLKFYIDGVQVFTSTAAVNQTPTGIVTDAVGAINDNGVGLAQFNSGYNGGVAHVAEWSTTLTPTQIANLTTSWRLAWQGDTSGTRYARILAWSGFAGPPTSIQSGATTDMGPASDVDGLTDAFTLLQNVVTTENGNHYVAANGTLTFEARTTRYDRLAPTYTFGTNVPTEFPFEGVEFDFDLDHVTNATQITQQSTGQVFTANVPSSQLQYATLTLQRTINVVNPQEVIDAATYLVNRYSQPLLRLDSLTLYPSRYSPDGVTFPLWGVLAGLEISTRIRVNMRPIGAPAIQFDGFVEQINWTTDSSTGDHVVVIQASPADLNIYWLFSALHTTVHTAATAGTNSIVLNALPDAASNPAAASFCSGLQMTLEPGTANSETLTVLSFSATSPGYTTFTVTFTANMAHNHAVNALVSEALPPGTTDPTTWDAVSILGVTTTLAY